MKHKVEIDSTRWFHQNPSKYRIPLDRLVIHPFNVKIYGDEQPSEELIDSLKKIGQLEPILIVPVLPSQALDGRDRYFILSGTRRYRAAKKLKWEDLEAHYVSGDYPNPTQSECEQVIIEFNRQRVKTPKQIRLEVSELLRIEKELAKQRLKLSKWQGKKGAVISQDVKGEAVEKVAKATGISESKVRNLATVPAAAEMGDTKAQAVVDKYDAGKISASAAASPVRPPKDPALVTAVTEQIVKARELTKRFKDAEVTRSSKPTLFHINFAAQSQQSQTGITQAFPYGLVVGVTFSVSDANAIAKMYQFGLTY
jgi:ParB-like chromosome segregation protein Spo0J